MTPLQKARAIVQSYPFYPDIYQIATALSHDQNAANANLLEYNSDTNSASMVAVPIAYNP